MKKFAKKSISKNCKAAIYAICLSGLVSIAIWDVVKIANDYIYDNRFTLLQQRYIEGDNITFLENPEVCLNYLEDKKIFHEAWYKNESELGSITRQISRTNFCKENDTFNAIDHFTLRDKIDILEYLRLIKTLDSIDEVAYVFSPFLNPNGSTIADLLDNFITSPCIDQIVEKFWSDLRPNYVRTPFFQRPGGLINLWWGADTPIESFPAMSATPSQICFHVPLNAFLTSDQNPAMVGFDLLQVNDQEHESVKATSISINFPTGLFSVDVQPGNLTLNAKIHISNIGIYDRSAFPPCTQEFKGQGERKFFP